ncbi:hypothetical protein JKP88DRAFT_267751 [Tribonema minus]|uniref:Uncharacterized protein n=1 Tax=Tribonema minus TaxID=303371 RepID=A0A835Z8U2_9STRA|nr:hypothetical protein JKP88DRAFT_267751 [Tribonema minus]
MLRALSLCVGASALAGAAAELMCGPTKSIPCSLYGCGGPDPVTGLTGQGPCFHYYPRTCQFTFKSSLFDYANNVIRRVLPKVTLPSMSEAGGVAVKINSYLTDPIVFVGNGLEPEACTITSTAVVACTKEAVYQQVTCPLETYYQDLFASLRADDTLERTLPLAGAFTIYGDGGGKEISFNPVSAYQAPSLYGALRETATVLSLSCTMPSQVVLESCIMFEAVPTNESPALAWQTAAALVPAFRFVAPPVPAVTLNALTDGTKDAGDALITPGNPIVLLNGVAPRYCYGSQTQYQGEDGGWLNYFLGADGHYVDLNHIVYVLGQNMFSETIQLPWRTLYSTFAGRNLRMLVTCQDALGLQLGVGYLYFGVTYAPWAGAAITCAGARASPVFCG